MGSGASAEVDAHLKKWDHALNDLSSLCRDHRKTLGGGGPNVLNTPRSEGLEGIMRDPKEADLSKSQRSDNPLSSDETTRGIRRRTSSLVSFDKRGSLKSPTRKTDVASFEEVASVGSNEVMMNPLVQSHSEGNSPSSRPHVQSPATSPRAAEGGKQKQSRDKIQAARKARHDHYQSYVDQPFATLEGKLACSHFATIAIGLSTLLGGQYQCEDRKKRVTVEDLFFAAHIPLNLLHTPELVLTEMYDIVREFVDVDARFKGKYDVEVVHLDIAPATGMVEEDGCKTGDRQTKVSLPDMRQAVRASLEGEDDPSSWFVYYDPFIVEQATIIEEEDEDESDEEDKHIMSNESFQILIPGAKKQQPQTEHQKENDGKFALIADFRSTVQPMVNLVEGAVTDRLHAQFQEIPFAILYKAMREPKKSGRAGGYIRVTERREGKEAPKDDVGFFFSPELTCGKVLGSLSDGIHAHTVAPLISHHVVACAWALHLLGGPRPNQHGFGRGLPVPNLIRSLELPIDVFVKCDLTLDQVYFYLSHYLDISGLAGTYRLNICPVLTKVSREDAAPTLSVFDLEAILIDVKHANADPESPAHIMIMQYNANIAHNVIDIANSSQWGILVGYDEDTQMARILDSDARRFCGTWTIFLSRLHKAITNYGYLMLGKVNAPQRTRSQGSSSSCLSPTFNMEMEGSQSNNRQLQSLYAPPGNEIGGLRHLNSTLQSRLELLSKQNVQLPVRDVISSFTYPHHAFQITQLAVALTRLGKFSTTEAILLKSLFAPSVLSSGFISLEAFKIVADEFIKVMKWDNELFTETHHCDPENDTFGYYEFIEMLEEQFCSKQLATDAREFIVHYAANKLQVFGVNNPVGEYGIVLEYDNKSKIVTVADVNFNRYFRTWQVDVKLLWNAMQFVQRKNHRSRGLVIIQKKSDKLQPPKPHKFTRPMKFSTAPLQLLFNTSASAQIQALSIAFAQFDFFYSPEEIFYEAYLKTVSDQRRRGSQAYAWRDVDVSLAMLNNNVNALLACQVATKFLEARKVHDFTVELEDDIDPEDMDEVLLEATDPKSHSVILAHYNTKSIYGLNGYGNSMGLIQSYDPEKQEVGLLDAELSKYGADRRCSLKKFVDGCDLENEGRSDYGLIRVKHRTEEEIEAAKSKGGKKGLGVAEGFSFGEATGSPHSPPQGTGHQTQQFGGRTRLVKIEQ